MEIELGTNIALVNGPPPYAPNGWRLDAVEVAAGFIATVALWDA
jgi:hypothetical protein